jgi:hypothetical protein
MRIIGFFRNDSGETDCMLANPCVVSFPRVCARLTALSFLVKVLGPHWSCLYDQPVSAFAAAFALVVPFVSKKGLPRPDNLLLLPTTLYGLFQGDINSQWLKSIVAAVDSRKVTACAHVVEIECVGARKVGVEGRAGRLQGCVRGRGQGGGVYESRIGDLKEQTSGARKRRKGRQGGKSSLHGGGSC